jgi:hypothetical protein
VTNPDLERATRAGYDAQVPMCDWDVTSEKTRDSFRASFRTALLAFLALDDSGVERLARAIVSARDVNPDSSMMKRVGHDHFEHSYFMWEDAITEINAVIAELRKMAGGEG